MGSDDDGEEGHRLDVEPLPRLGACQEAAGPPPAPVPPSTEPAPELDVEALGSEEPQPLAGLLEPVPARPPVPPDAQRQRVGTQELGAAERELQESPTRKYSSEAAWSSAGSRSFGSQRTDTSDAVVANTTDSTASLRVKMKGFACHVYDSRLEEATSEVADDCTDDMATIGSASAMANVISTKSPLETPRTATPRSPRKVQRPACTAGESLGPPVASRPLQMVIDSFDNVSDHYNFRALLGEGNFGKVRRAVVKVTGTSRAVKSINKAKIKSKQQEVAIMKIIDHPNLVMLYESFEDSENLHLVMELCTGGHLLSRLERSPTNCLSELEAAIVMQQILRATSYLHMCRICHRDLKAENCLIAGRGPLEQGKVKVGDFGLSCHFKPKQVFASRVGTPTHWAPEVVERKYTKDCDHWSCGVIMYHILCGVLPFSDKGDCLQVRERHPPSFSVTLWRNVSDTAVALVKKLICWDLKDRHTAKHALQHQCFLDWVPKVEEVPFKAEHLSRLRSFRQLNRLKRAAFTVIMTMLGERYTRNSQKLFLSLDEDGDGLVSFEDLRWRLKPGSSASGQAGRAAALGERALAASGQDAAALQILRNMAETEGSVPKPFGYMEFLAATFARENCLTDDICKAAFRNFDKNGDGYISLSGLASGKLLGHLAIDEVTQLLEDLDRNSDSTLDLEEFSLMLRGGERQRN